MKNSVGIYCGKKHFPLGYWRETWRVWWTIQQNNVAANIAGTTNTLQLFPKCYCVYFLNDNIPDRTTKIYGNL